MTSQIDASAPPRRPSRLGNTTDDDRLDRLLGDGLAALRREDAEIRALLTKAYPPTCLGNCNTGIVYWLYETTLAYLLFKAWLQTSPTHWEVPYPEHMQSGKGSDLKADLVVYDIVAPETLTPAWGLEAKWFPDTSSKMLDLLQHDIDRLLQWSELKRRFLIVFWSGQATKFEQDWAKRMNAMPGRFVGGNGRVGDVEPCWVDAFPTDRHDAEPSREGYFAMGAFHIRAR